MHGDIVSFYLATTNISRLYFVLISIPLKDIVFFYVFWVYNPNTKSVFWSVLVFKIYVNYKDSLDIHNIEKL